MILIPGGTFRMRSDHHYPEEAPATMYAARHAADAPKACCVPANPRGGREEDSLDPTQPEIKIPLKVVKGGSHLCAPNYWPALSPCSPTRRSDRHLDQPYRLSVHCA
jgi:hypothetical protein